MQATTYSSLRSNLSSYLDAVVDDCEPLVVHRSNGNSVVLISLDEFNAILETQHILASPQAMADIRQAEADIKAGKGVELSIDEI